MYLYGLNTSGKDLKIKILFVFGICCLSLVSAIGQDAHYTQYFANPLYTNPALSGTHNGKFRVFSIYRSQWQSALETPYKTVGAGGDYRFEVGKNRVNYPDYGSVGVLFNSETVSLFDHNTTQIQLAGAFHKSLSQRSTNYIGIGFQLGIIQKNINYENLFFEDQFNNINQFNLPTGEVLPPNNIGVFDMSFGLHYTATINESNQVFLGLGAFHLNQPNVSFYQKSELTNPNLIKVEKLNTRLMAHVSWNATLNEFFTLSPRVLYSKQGQHTEISAGTNFRFTLNQDGSNAFHVGPYIRMVQGETASKLESIMFMTAFEKGNLLFGFSYDMNLTDILNDRNGFNSFELSIVYTGQYEDDSYICPEF